MPCDDRRTRERLTRWAGVMLFNAVAYYGSSTWPAQARIVPETALDRLIGTTPWSVGPYLSFFVLILWAFWAAPADRLPRLTRSILVCSGLAALCFMLYPTTLAYPPAWAVHLDTPAVHWLRLADTPRNCLPSLHGAITVVCLVALIDRRKPWQAFGWTLWALLIGWSTIALRQHLALDITAGALLGTLVALGVAWQDRRARSHPRTQSST